MKKKVSDYIVDFLVDKGISDVFGYPGGMVTHLIDSFSKREKDIRTHLNYHEQASAFCACGYAQAGNTVGVAYATSGPGATNLITGICNAYFDSIPTLFITGQVNTFESSRGEKIRQRGFQETDIVSMVSGVTNYSAYIENATDIRFELEKAWHLINEGRKGPALLDIPMNIFSTVVETNELRSFSLNEKEVINEDFNNIVKLIEESQRPVFLLGAGAKEVQQDIKRFVQKYRIPVVTSMLAFDSLTFDSENNYGFIGAYGKRAANFIVAKSDLVIAIGTRLDIRQVGAKREAFAPDAKIIRVDIDKNELDYKVKKNETQLKCSATFFIKELSKYLFNFRNSDKWIQTCNMIKKELEKCDYQNPNLLVNKISKVLPENILITTDVGQNQVWIAQSFEIKEGQRVFSSGGHGAMGYSLPAAIGAFYATGKHIVSFNGDGGIQMNIQELQFLAREKLPITVVIFNNRSLGMIRHFQEMYFEENFYQTVCGRGYSTPDFSKLADGYGLNYKMIRQEEDVEKIEWCTDAPLVVEIVLDDKTYVFPKLEYGKPNQDQEPLLDRSKYEYLMKL